MSVIRHNEPSYLVALKAERPRNSTLWDKPVPAPAPTPTDRVVAAKAPPKADRWTEVGEKVRRAHALGWRIATKHMDAVRGDAGVADRLEGLVKAMVAELDYRDAVTEIYGDVTVNSAAMRQYQRDLDRVVKQLAKFVPGKVVRRPAHCGPKVGETNWAEVNRALRELDRIRRGGR